MTIIRKLVLPTLIFFSLVLMLLAAFYTYNQISTERKAEERQLMRLSQALNVELTALENLAVGLSIEIASDPEVQSAMAAQDRERLANLTQTRFQKLNQQFDIPRFQFHVPPATSFLRLHEPARFGDDLSTTRPLVATANIQRRPISGLEISQEGLTMRSIQPISFDGRHAGTVEFGLNVDRALIVQLKQLFGADWQIMTVGQSSTVTTAGPISDLILNASTLASPVYAPASSYEAAITGEERLERVQTATRSFTILTIPLKDYSNKVIAVADVVVDRTDTIASIQNQLLLGGIVILASLIIGWVALSAIIRRTLRPVTILTQKVSALAAGDLSEEVPVTSQDELGILANGINKMIYQLRGLISNLELHVADRTRDLERRSMQLQTAADVSREISLIGNMDELMQSAVDKICERFDFYFGGIFLIDELGEYVFLRTVTGQVSEILRTRSVKLRVGQEGMVGYVCAKGETRIALDVDLDEVYYKLDVLTLTRSEITLPLKVGEHIIGALDLQSSTLRTFSPEDVAVLETLTDQLATAIENRRLVEKLEKALEETSTTYEQGVRHAWALAAAGMKTSAYEYDRIQVRPADQNLPEEWKQQLQGGKTVVLHSNDGHSHSTLLVPVILREQVIGVIGVEEDAPDYQWSPDEITIVEAAATQAALTMENARLLEETQLQAEREQMIGQIAAHVRETLDIDTVLKTALRELGSNLEVAEVEVRVGQPQMLKQAHK